MPNLLALSAFLCGAAVASGQETFEYPLSIAVGESGTFIADRTLHSVWKLNGNKPELFFKGDKKFRTPLNAVRCVELDADGNLLAGDSSTREIYRFDAAGKPTPLTGGLVGIPMDMAVNKAGDIYVTDLEIQRVMKVPKAGGKPEEVTQISGCRGLFVDSEDHVWVVSTTKDQLHRIAPDGKSEVIVADRPFKFPHTVVVDAEMTAYVCDGFAGTIWKIPKGGEPQAWATGAPLVKPVGMALHGGKVYVADPYAVGILEIDSEGKVTPVVVNEPAK